MVIYRSEKSMLYFLFWTQEFSTAEIPSQHRLPLNHRWIIFFIKFCLFKYKKEWIPLQDEKLSHMCEGLCRILSFLETYLYCSYGYGIFRRYRDKLRLRLCYFTPDNLVLWKIKFIIRISQQYLQDALYYRNDNSR